MTNYYSEIVVGAGAMGSAAIYHLANLYQNDKNAKILLLEQFQLLHENGSSGGESRATRIAVAEGNEYIPLVKRSNELWRTLEITTGNESGYLYNTTGGLIISTNRNKKIISNSDTDNYLFETQKIAAENNISHNILSHNQIQKSYPQFIVNKNNTGYFEDSMGYLHAKRCIETQLHLASAMGAEIRDQEKMIGFQKTSDGKLKIITDKNEYITKKLLLTMGPWVKNFLDKQQRELFTLYRKNFYYFEIEKQYIDLYQPNKLPIFFLDLDERKFLYGFPIIGNKTTSIKIATDQYDIIDNIDHANKNISSLDPQKIYQQYIKSYFNGVSNICQKISNCTYTATDNWRFVIDFLPGYNDQVIIASPCSGHGFKYSAAIGESLAELMTSGKCTFDLIKQFGNVFKH